MGNSCKIARFLLSVPLVSEICYNMKGQDISRESFLCKHGGKAE
jgi:hypothetical protein